jgi:hypothetical protein
MSIIEDLIMSRKMGLVGLIAIGAILAPASPRTCLGQTSAANLSKRLAEEHRRLSNQASQMRIVRDGLAQQSDNLLNQRSGIIQGRKAVASQDSTAKAQSPDQVDYSKYDRCPNGNSW